MKTCIRCEVARELSDYHNEKRSKDGKAGACKLCVKISGQKYRAEHRESIAIRKAKYQKEHPEFGRAANIRSYKKDPTRRLAKGKEHYRKNIDAQRLRSRNYYKENPLIRKAAIANWRKHNSQRERDMQSIWMKNNPEKVLASAARYMAKPSSKVKRLIIQRARETQKLNAFPKWADKEAIKEIYELSALRTEITGFKWNVDHIIPLKSKLVCGLHVENNLRVIPAIINIAKGNRFDPDAIPKSWSF